jgi:hypothetical protein
MNAHSSAHSVLAALLAVSRFGLEVPEISAVGAAM